MSTVKLWLPDGLNLRPLMEAVGLGAKTHYAEWLVSEVGKGHALRHAGDGLVPLASEYIQAGIPKKLVPAIKLALNPSVLIDDGTYQFHQSTGTPGKCLGYALSPEWRGRKLVPVFRQASELAKKLDTLHASILAEQRGRVAAMSATHQSLHRHMEETRLVRNADTQGHPIGDYLCGDRPRWFLACDQGRVHHPVASCPRTFRKHLRLGSDDPVTLIDVGTSQPLILGLLARLQVTTGEKSARDDDRLKHPPAPGPLPLLAPYSDIDEYIRECVEGDLYAVMAGRMETVDWRDKRYSREDAKDGWMKAVYGDPDRMPHLTPGKALRLMYPGWFAVVRKLAYCWPDGELARRMQRLESDAMIGGVAARIVRERPGLRFVTVHDAFLVHAEDAGYTAAIIRREWQTRFGITPRLKTETFGR